MVDNTKRHPSPDLEVNDDWDEEESDEDADEEVEEVEDEEVEEEDDDPYHDEEEDEEEEWQARSSRYSYRRRERYVRSGPTATAITWTS